MLLIAGADPNIQNRYEYEDGHTALMLASKYCDTKIVKMLLDAGADPNLRDVRGNTALMLASENYCKSNEEIVKILLNAMIQNESK